jgi:hypothetical protein
MTQDEIIEMANQSQLFLSIWIDDEGDEIASLVAFAKLVAAKATDEANARSNTSWSLMCKKMVEDEREACAVAAMKAAEIAVDTAVAFEREACAKMCEDESMNLRAHDLQRIGASKCAAAIRARGEA